MNSPVIVVAVLEAKPDLCPRVIDSFREVSPLVHQEHSCELYAANIDGDRVVMIERWTTRADLDAHAAGAPLAKLNELNDGLLTHPYDAYFLTPVVMGDPEKGTV